jgi:hypothetical protein
VSLFLNLIYGKNLADMTYRVVFLAPKCAIKRLVACVLLAILAACLAQNNSAQGIGKSRTESGIVFAILDDGKLAEPIVFVQKKILRPPVSGDSDLNTLKQFLKNTFPKNRKFNLVFGGGSAGIVTIESSNAEQECAPNLARIRTISNTVTLKGNIMALGVDSNFKLPIENYRRAPTQSERKELEALVLKEFVKTGASKSSKLFSHNLTALDVDKDGRAEFVGSYWVESGRKSRLLLFFIAERDEAGKMRFGFKELKTVRESEVMSKKISDVDTGVYHERLLDMLDTDSDSVSEIFTYLMNFENSVFYIYRRFGNSWERIYEFTNYHCGF